LEVVVVSAATAECGDSSTLKGTPTSVVVVVSRDTLARSSIASRSDWASERTKGTTALRGRKDRSTESGRSTRAGIAVVVTESTVGTHHSQIMGEGNIGNHGNVQVTTRSTNSDFGRTDSSERVTEQSRGTVGSSTSFV